MKKRNLILILVCLVIPQSGWAHGNLSGQLHSNFLGLEQSFVSFNRPGIHGSGFMTTASIAWELFPWLGFLAETSYLVVDSSTDVPLNAPIMSRGLGDSILGLTSAFELGPGQSLRITLPVELPSGNSDTGLGAGHYGLMPSIQSTHQVGQSLVVLTGLRYAANISEVKGASHAHSDGSTHEHTIHGSLLTPHAEQELKGDIGIALKGVKGSIALGVQASQMMVPEVGLGPIGPTLSTEVAVNPVWSVGFTSFLPVAGQNRQSWTCGIAIRFYPSAMGTEPKAQECTECAP